MKRYKLIVEKHPDGYVTYPLSIKGVVVGQGDSYEEVIENIKDAIKLHIEDRIANNEDIPKTELTSLTTIEIEA